MNMRTSLRIACAVLLAASLFAGGYLTAASKFGAPKTIIHVSLIKWKDGVSDADKQKALDGVREMAAKILGIKNVWLKATRMQPRDYHAAFVIEFENREAAEDYAMSPVHEEWSKFFLSIREASISPQITN
jgi:hypothetical protein